MIDWTKCSAATLGRGIAAGDIDPVDLTGHFLDAIAASPVADRIYARTTPGRAMSEARAARARAQDGRRLSPLDGVPINWKDLFDTAGIATEAGSAMLSGRVPETDAPVMRTATAMGTVCLGKTHMSELAFSGLGLNPVTATPPCINDGGAVPGGSSSGAAASVAFGLAAAAVGSDTGGSVRIPAAWNDLVGLKTTHGRISLDGVVPLAAWFDTVGPLTRSVEDAALMLGVLEGRPAPDLTAPASLKGRRFAVLRTIVTDDLRDEPARAHEDALKRLEIAGSTLVEFDAPEIEGPMGDSAILYTTEAWAHWRHLIEEKGDAMFGPIRDRFASGQVHSGADYAVAWQGMLAARRIWAERTAGFDAVLAPTAANIPPQVDRLMEQGDYYVTENLLTLRNTRVGNLMGVCGITLPTGHPSCGLMMLGRAMGEDRLLRVAAAAERALA
ncbi:amidase [Citreimonas salinaria]|uniref:Aspartyl-tRNA(Asn)/glutamyl-tRNA(Gln) amidotransferase subunit A n=1 Tax=Citreimonas salinaria TaxID=321339 RepID=A0A1H3HLL4_9RHOB|nr:amidase family protein [Citreimonas salinaria]SDY16416.1 aspartyl-tRNA(Asn)/glutamyl-tRNA(Gln) amidotransferase subunit A [Citreimonas salinaria]